MVLYTAQDYLSYKQLAKRLGFTESLVSNYITNLIEKEIPILKQFQDRIAFVKLDAWFKEMQAKENILQIDDRVAREYTQI